MWRLWDRMPAHHITGPGPPHQGCFHHGILPHRAGVGKPSASGKRIHGWMDLFGGDTGV